MKSPILKQEKLLTKQRKRVKNVSLRFLMEFTRLKFYLGKKDEANLILDELLKKNWAKSERTEIVLFFIDYCFEFCNTVLLAEKLETAKKIEMGRDASFSVLKIVLGKLNFNAKIENNPELLQQNNLPPEISQEDVTNDKTEVPTNKVVTNETALLDTESLLDKLKEMLTQAEKADLQRLIIYSMLKFFSEQLNKDEIEALVQKCTDTMTVSPFSLAEREHLLNRKVYFLPEEHSAKNLLKEVNLLLPMVSEPIIRARLNYLKGVLLEHEESLIEAMHAYESGLRYLFGVKNQLETLLSIKLATLYGKLGLYRQAFWIIKAAMKNPYLSETDLFSLREIQLKFLRKTHQTKLAAKIGNEILQAEQKPERKQLFMVLMAKLYYDAQELNIAETYVSQIQEELLPKSYIAEVFSLKSSILIHKKKPDEAIIALKQAIEYSNNDKEKLNYQVTLGKLYREIGEIERVVETFKEIKVVSPEAEEAKEAVTAMKELRSELEQAKLDDVITSSTKEKIIKEITQEVGEKNLFERLQTGLAKTRDSFVGKLESVFSAGKINDDMLEELEETLILADVGFDITNLIINRIRKAHRNGEITNGQEIKPFLIKEISSLLSKYEGKLIEVSEPPLVIMMIGVNGVGKTTTIAKIAHSMLEKKESVVIAAADTFRAGAIEQISEWGRRLNVDVIKHKSGSDPSAVAYDGVHAALARKKDCLIIDTAGRLHTQVNLMEELKKIRRIVSRECANAPHEILLVLDATNGQNAISQAKIFKKDLDVSGIVLTKLDGTAKGGIIISIAHELDIPIKFIGVGEKMYDLRPFNATEFVEALFGVDKK